MIHFGLAFNVCPDRKRGDTRSNAIGLVQFQRLRKEHPEFYCARCAGEQPRTDSERYAELRALVEAWQRHLMDGGRHMTTQTHNDLAGWSHR